MIVDARASEPLKKGDRVVLVMGGGTVLKSAFVLYMVPLGALIAGYYLGRELASALGIALRGELFPALFGFFLLGLSFLGIRWYDRRKRNDRRFGVSVRKAAQ
jgi:positive regulator of sigma E activity